MVVQIQLRRGTAAEWTTADPILSSGELGVETDTGKFKVGDGINNWSGLSYSSGIQGPQGDEGPEGPQGPQGEKGDKGDPGGSVPHASTHENSGADEIVVDGLSGELAEPQTPKTHAHSESDVTNLESDLAGKETPTGAQAKVDTHKVLTTGVHGVGAGTIAQVGDIGVDSNLSAAAQDAVTKRHTQVHGSADHTGTIGTPTQVGLSNVTNDSQLKRADGDLNSFAVKGSPISADVLIIEDSAASYAKKKVTIGTLPFGGGSTPNQYNQSVAQQAGFSSDTYLAGSSILIPLNSLKAGTRYHLIFDVVKTAAGTATPIITIRFGTAGAIGDAARLTFTFLAQTGVADNGTFDVWVTFRSVGSGTSAIVQGASQCRHRLQITGLQNLVCTSLQVTSGGFDSTVANSYIGASVNGGSSAAWTVQLVQAELENLV